jgi:hypothetical protein
LRPPPRPLTIIVLERGTPLWVVRMSRRPADGVVAVNYLRLVLGSTANTSLFGTGPLNR